MSGEVIPPSDKSVSHRAILLNSIARGRATVSNLLLGNDCISTMTCLQALGARIQLDPSSPNTVRIEGIADQGLHEADNVLDAGNSGTTIRLLTGLLAVQPFLSIITGDSSLRSRPMGRVIHPLRLMGANIWGKGNDSLAPLAIKGGKLHGITYPTPVASAQLKSALLIAALFSTGETTIREPAESRDHTELMLQAMGARLEKKGCEITLHPLSAPLKAIDLDIPGDISAAACWLVAGAIHPNASIIIRGVGINPTRTGIIDVLLQMGAKLKIENRRWQGSEPVADLLIESSELKGTHIGGEIIPRTIDELPLVALAACIASGTTIIRDAAELRVKESDRISTTIEELSKLGAQIEERPDGMIIHGGRRLQGAECSSHDDHRLAMLTAIAGMAASGETVLHNAEAVDISYPDFWQNMERFIGGQAR